MYRNIKYVKLILMVIGISAVCTATGSTLACENDILPIKCEHGLINVVKAFWGRQNRKCLHIFQIWIGNYCSSDVSTSIVKKHCDGLKECSVPATTRFLGDPCILVPKYLQIAFICVDPPKPKIINNRVVCEDHEMDIRCPRNEIIIVLDANYGRTNRTICSHSTNDNCHNEGVSHSIVSDHCHNKQQCKIWASNKVFGDPCVNTPKYLSVDYECDFYAL